MNESAQTFEIPLEVAELYEQLFVPAIFAGLAPVTLDAAGLTAANAGGKRLLDVGCGTGIVSRSARARFGTEIDTVGLDLNPAMLTVAARIAPEEVWRHGDVGELPFGDDEFDVAVSQMAAMFFPDLPGALAEMARVVRPGGHLAWVVPSSLDEQPAYGPLVDIAVAHIDESARALLGGTYWCRGDRDAFARDVEAAGLVVTSARPRAATARFDSPAAMVDVEIDGSPLADRVDRDVRARITVQLATRLADYVRPGEPFEVPLVCNVMSARKPA